MTEHVLLNRTPVEAGGPLQSRRQFFRHSALVTGGLVAAAGATPLLAEPALAPAPSPQQETHAGHAEAAALPVAGVVRKNINALSTAELGKLQEAFRIVGTRPESDPTSQRFQANIHRDFCDTPDPRKQVHFSWKFLPWHRGYLYYFERILQAAVGDPTVALPYWDWSVDLSIPSRYWGTGNPLFDPRRVATPTSRVDPSQTRISGLLTIPTFQGFGGDAAAAGSLEGGPHNYVHRFIGGDMGAFSTAGRDPIFFSGHHSNIDRVWDLWLKVPGHQNPSDPAWLDLKFTYWDVNGRPFETTVRDILKLEYSYANGGTGGVTAAGFGERKVVDDAPISVDVEGLEATGRVFTAEASASRRPAILRVEGLELPSDESTTIRVFARSGATAATSTEDPTFLGSFTVLATEHQHGPVNVNIDVTDELAALTTDRLSLSVVPVGIDEARKDNGRISFDRITLLGG